MKSLSAVLALVLLFSMACEKQGDSHSHGDGEHTHASEPAADKQAKVVDATAKQDIKKEDKQLVKVDVSDEGTKFDPPVQPSQLPEGAWYCDMGTVHWAAMVTPEDGKCPQCSMDLKQYSAAKLDAQKKKAVEAHEHDDHVHGEHGHTH